MLIYILLIIIVLSIVGIYYFSRKAANEIKNTEGFESWSFPSLQDQKDSGIFDLSAQIVNDQVIKDINNLPNKGPLLTKSLIKDGKTLLQLTIFEDKNIVLIYNKNINNIDIADSELEELKTIIADIKQNPPACCPDVGKDYAMTFLTVHDKDNTKTYYADGSCPQSSMLGYHKLNEFLDKKLSNAV